MDDTSFIDLLRESTIIQGIITLIVIGGLVYQLVTTGTASQELLSLATLIVGFYFGQKSMFQTRQAIKELGKRDDG